jgi:hypothetical protein
MSTHHPRACAGLAALALLAWIGCGPREGATPSPEATPSGAATTTPAAPIQRIEATPENVKKAEEALQKAAERDRRARACLSFDDLKATVFKEPWEGGKYIVNGDTPIIDEKQLEEFYEESVRPPQQARLIIHQVSGMDAKWNQQQKISLSYCVSRDFGPRYDRVVQDMENAGREWEKSAAVGFVHDSSQDDNCNASNAAVVFDVRPVNVGGEYLARAFFPNEPRAARNVLIEDSTFELEPDGELQPVGVLRHELGHAIGFRHEHTRPESGACFEDRDWRPLTSYDAFSVMHYPQCNGLGDWSLTLTDKDRNGSACVYGAAPGFTIDPTLVNVADCVVAPPGSPSPSGQEQTQSSTGQSVARNARRTYGPFAVRAGTVFEASMGGPNATGDPDLYVRFGAPPSTNPRRWDCRPYLFGPTEVCSLTVPSGVTQAHVMVHGYAAGAYDLQIRHTP